MSCPDTPLQSRDAAATAATAYDARTGNVRKPYILLSAYGVQFRRLRTNQIGKNPCPQFAEQLLRNEGDHCHSRRVIYFAFGQ